MSKIVDLNITELKIERQILERGCISYEDLIQWLEFKPWILKALSENSGQSSPEGIKRYMAAGNRISYETVKRALLNYEIKMLEGESKHD